jgi:hypothetical protein
MHEKAFINSHWGQTELIDSCLSILRGDIIHRGILLLGVF